MTDNDVQSVVFSSISWAHNQGFYQNKMFSKMIALSIVSKNILMNIAVSRNVFSTQTHQMKPKIF